MTLLLLRHGESEGNVERRIQGWLELPLTEAGHAQAQAAGRHLASVGATALYTSPLLRARQTAAAVEEHTGLDAVELPDFREYCFGEAQGMTWDEAAARWGLVDRDWGVGRVPGEEGMVAFRERVARQFEQLIARYSEATAIAVVHGGVVGAIVSYICGLGPSHHAALYTGNCAIVAVAHERGRHILLSLNERCHLRDEPAHSMLPAAPQ